MAQTMTVALEVVRNLSMTYRQRLEMIRTRLKDLVMDRMSAVAEEAATISSDMDALRLRIERHGDDATIEDIRTARWWRTRDQYALARQMFHYVSEVMGVAVVPVRLIDDRSGDEAIPSALDGDEIV